MGILDFYNQPNNNSLDQNDLTAFLQALTIQNRDPFTRPLPGDKALPTSLSQPNSMNSLFNQQATRDDQPQGFENVSTDFADTQPGLPNLPDSFQGFGFGQTAPKVKQNMNMRQQLLEQLLQQFMNMQSGNANGGFA